MKRSTLVTWFVMILLVLIKLWLVGGQSLWANPQLGHDDALYIRLAQHIVNGRWLGPYNNLTLAKGSFYPIWIAASHILGIPLLFSQNLLYIAACLVFSVAIRPLLARPIDLVVPFGFLLFNPMSADTSISTRVIREGIYPALALLVIAAAIGLFLRQERPCHKPRLWAFALGMSLAAYWLTREEGIWLLPSVASLVVFAAYRTWKLRAIHWARWFSVWGLSFAVWIALVGVVMALNQYHYGLFAKTELDSRAFKSAYAAITRPKPARIKPFVAQSARLPAYEVSPAFAELKPYLEGDIGLLWSKASSKDDIPLAGAVFVWAFRDAVARAGYYSDGRFAADYYQRIADEINAACESQRLDCVKERSSMMPAWQSDYLRPLLGNVVRAALYLSKLDDFTSQRVASRGTQAYWEVFRDLTGEEISGDEAVTVLKGWAFKEGSSISLTVAKEGYGLEIAMIEFRPSQKIYQKFLSRGKDIPAARQARFEIETACPPDECMIEVWSEGSLLWREPIEEMEEEVDSGGLHFQIDRVSERELFPGQARLNRFKLRVLSKIGRLYQVFIPYLTIAALMGYAFLTFKTLKRSFDLLKWATLTALLVGVCARIVLLAIIETMAFPAIHSLYFAPAYPMLMAFIVLTLLWIGYLLFSSGGILWWSDHERERS